MRAHAFTATLERPRHFAIALLSTAALVGLALTPDLAAAAGSGKSGSTSAASQTTGSQSSAKSEMITIGGQQMPARSLIGKPVVTGDDNKRIGEVVDLIHRGNTYNDAIVRLSAEHSQMGVAAGSGDKRLPSNAPPTVVGGKTVAVQFSDLKPAKDGQALRLDDKAATTLKEFSYQAGSENYWTTRNDMAGRMGGSSGTSGGGTSGASSTTGGGGSMSGSGSTSGTTSGASTSGGSSGSTSGSGSSR